MEKPYIKFFKESENWRDYPDEEGEEEFVPEPFDLNNLQRMSREEADKLYGKYILRAYLEAGLWLGHYDDGNGDDFEDGLLSEVADIENIHPDTLRKCEEIINLFLSKAELLPGFSELDHSTEFLSQVAHDLFISGSGAAAAFREHDDVYGEDLAFELEKLADQREFRIDAFYLGADGWVHAN